MTFVGPLTAGTLFATVTTNDQTSGTAEQVATIVPVITSSKMNIGINGNTFTINSFGFYTTTPDENILTFGTLGDPGHHQSQCDAQSVDRGQPQ